MTKIYLLLALPLMSWMCSCSSLGTYFEDRALDLIDVIDPKYGVAVPACVKVEVTDYLGTGLGLAAAWHTHEWFGRRLFIRDGGYFIHLVFIGVDDFGIDSNLYGSGCVLGIQGGWRPPMISRFRVGGELLLGAHAGLYLNLGEVADFILGFATLDIAYDDGVEKGAPLWRRLGLVHAESLSVSQAVRALDDEDVKVRKRAIIKLSESKDPDTAEALMGALKDSNEYVRYVAAETLGEIKDTRAVESLISALCDEDEWVVQAAYEALQEITGKDFGYDHEKWNAWWESTR